jgi:hypothetical protein
MEKSQLEKIGNVQLFFLLKKIMLVLNNNIPEMNDYGFADLCDESGKIVGLELTYEDYNYIVATLKMNEGFDYSTKKPSSELERPIAAVYSFDVDEHRTESVRRTYRHKMLSYDIDLLIPTAELLQGDGNFDYYEGREVDVDYYDGDTNSVEFDKDSIVKIE